MSKINLRNKYQNFGPQLKKMRTEKGYTVRQAALQAGISSSYWSQVENAKREIPTPKTLEKIAKGIRTNKHIIFKMAGIINKQQDSAYNPSNLNLDGFTTYDNNVRYAPIYGTIKAGPGGFAYEDHEGTMIVGGKHALTNHKLIWLRVSGDSMTGDGIHSDDLALIDTEAECECTGEILAVVYDSVFGTLKHVTKSAGTIVLSASNPIYKPIVLSGHDLDTFKIVGKAISIQRDI